MKASARITEKRLARFSTPDLKEQIRAYTKSLRPAGAVPQAAAGASEEAERERAAEGGIFRYVSSEKINN